MDKNDNLDQKDKQIKELGEKINELNSSLQYEKDKNKNLMEQLNEEKNKNNILFKENNDLNKKIENLNEKLKRYPIMLEENEKLLSIIFSSEDQKINYSMICKNTDTFNDLEKRLYKECPDFSCFETCFLYKDKIINKNQTLDENKIKNGETIIINKRDE